MRFIYNMDFLIAALAFLSLLLFHFYNQKKLDNIRSRIFQTFIFVGIFDIIFDILCTLLISAENPEYVGITELTLILLYLMQLFVPYIYLCYVKSLRVDSERQAKRIIRVWMIPTAVMAVLVLTNLLTGLFFYFDDAGVYCRGPLYLWMYGFAIVYVVIAAVDSIVFFKKLGRRKFVTIWEFLIIATVSVMIQAVNNDLLMTGFGISLGITVLYLTLHNPYGYTDSLTGSFNKQYFERWIREQIDKRKKLNLIAVDVQRIKNVNKMLGASTGDQILLEKIQNIKVNLSPLELLKPGQGHALIELIREYELPYSFFQFEITETVAS